MSGHLPRYLVGQWGDHLALAGPSGEDAADLANAAMRHAIGEYHLWTPSETPAATDLCFVVMRQNKPRIPHPNWQALPHVYRRTTIAEHHAQVLTDWAKAAFDKARQQSGGYTFGQLVIAPSHDVVDLAFALHAIMPAFEP